jgi:cytochrome bd ubiquinol oxidase subunit II
MTLVATWFSLIAVLWTGFFVLEGFDLGVGMLHAVVGRDETGRRVAIGTIGPLWDGNEVWLIVAVAGMFAAFPGWYATMFSGFYLLVVLLLAGLIVRGVSFEFRDKVEHARWRHTWDGLLTIGSLLVPLVVGITLGDLLKGVPIASNQEYTGSFGDLLQPYALFVGVTLVLLCLLHGSAFLMLKTTGEVRRRARWVARAAAPVTSLAVIAFAFWTHATAGRGDLPNLFEVLAILAVLAAVWLVAEGSEGWAFTVTTLAMASTILSIFTDLYPRVMVSSTNSAFDLTVHNTASGSYALKVMTVVAVILLPVVITYQAWTYHVFRRRVRPEDVMPPPVPRQPLDSAEASIGPAVEP